MGRRRRSALFIADAATWSGGGSSSGRRQTREMGGDRGRLVGSGPAVVRAGGCVAREEKWGALATVQGGTGFKPIQFDSEYFKLIRTRFDPNRTLLS
jgi:hypothetical protein